MFIKMRRKESGGEWFKVNYILEIVFIFREAIVLFGIKETKYFI